jgi:hypothetical protein
MLRTWVSEKHKTCYFILCFQVFLFWFVVPVLGQPGGLVFEGQYGS